MEINNLFSNTLRMAVVRSSEVDQNNDGLLDRLEIGVQLPLKSTESITGIQALFTHNCILKDKTLEIIFYKCLIFVTYDNFRKFCKI